ncbi:hypothetical protein HHO41_08230 [Bacillus sp. DNRA2]|uniref:hypothetical protein n=1 Tax=Bacillus sp. DNRA2 TaxID=2723053 RepID=UPI00145EF4DC|nr:hypothetical protein [Bacillus sp. DNRA2]NMD70278.1 hypothetical protein [Bacillus sp. DNRA2]
MGNMDWKDKQLENLLREMPKINDKQNPHELYQAISLKLNKKRTFGILIPSIASLAVVILFMFFGKHLFFLDNQINHKSSQESKMMDKSEEQQINFKDEANSDNHQEQFDTMMKTEPLKKPYLLLYKENNSQPMFVQAHEGVATFEEAIELMRNDEPNQGLTASIPPELQIGKVSVIRDHALVQLTNRNELPQTQEVNFAFEAILLSAKEFGYSTVEFKHDSQAGTGVFPINQPIEVPTAANNQETK